MSPYENPPPIVFVDTETTGLDPETERIFELAIVEANGEQHVFRFRPEDDVVARMHPKALEVNRYKERIAAPGWEWDYEPDVLAEDVWHLLDGKHIVGAVPDFDARHLAAAYRRVGIDRPDWHYHLIDVEALAIGYLAAKGRTFALPWDSEDLSRALGIEPDTGRHEALYDALWAKRIYEAVTNGASR